MRRYVICYDIADDRRRERLRRLLRRYGNGVQESVFEVDTTPRRLAELLRRLRREIDRAEDAVRVYGLCAQCQRDIEAVAGPAVSRRPLVHVV